MRTVTFYSYKGGTGRTLLLANVAMLAARMGWKVVAIDVDLEAPGLTYKLFEQPPSRCDGLVGWLRDRFATGKAPLSLGDSLLDVELTSPFEDGGWLKVMPAGRHPSLNYFQDLIGLRLEQRINEGPGVDAFVDLQKQVLAELDPDLLLLDARTGISSTNLVTTRVLADDVIALTLDSREQLEGTRSVLRSLTPLTSLRTEEPLRLHVVLSRVAGRPADVGSYAVTDAEHVQIARVRTFLETPADPLRATLTLDGVHLLHSEPSLIHGDFLALARSGVPHARALHIDYIRIVRSLLGERIIELAKRAIAESESPRQRHSLAGFFGLATDIAESRAGLPPSDEPVADEAPDPKRRLPQLVKAEPPDPEERVRRLEQLVKRDSTLMPILAHALLDLAEASAAAGSGDAVEPTERAVSIYEDVVRTSSRLLPSFARALDNLGVRYREAGRHVDAAATSERAVETYRELAGGTHNQVGLALALSNLSVHYSQAGHLLEAVAAVEQAVQISEAVATTNPWHLEALGVSLLTLANRLADVGRRAEAVPVAARAVTVYEWQDDGELPSLGQASAQHNLGKRLSDVGRLTDALAATERAVELHEKLARSNPKLRGSLAEALADLAVINAELHHNSEAVALVGRAITIYEDLIDSDVSFESDLSRALGNLSHLCARAGDHLSALAAQRRVVHLQRAIAERSPAVGTPLLATSLRVLASQLEVADDAVGAQAASAESERLLATLLDDA